MKYLANVREYLKCDVCGEVTLLRFQVGWLEEYPIRVHCGNCGILMDGNVYVDFEQAQTKFIINNAKEVEEIIPSYYMQASGEFITEKIRSCVSIEETMMSPPFFQTLSEMGNEGYLQFKKNTLQFLSLSIELWPKIRRINELWFSENYAYLGKEINKILSEKQFPANNELEYLRGVHQINIMAMSNILNRDKFHGTTNLIWNELYNLLQSNIVGFNNLITFVTSKDMIIRWEEKIFNLTDQFMKLFRFFIPVYSMKFYKERDNNLSETFSITTVTFNDLKQFYMECYESAVELSTLIVAFNNLKYRGNYETMINKRKDIQTIDDFQNKAKGIRIGFIDGSEKFDELIYPYLENKIRNAIGHNTCKYDGLNQMITYYPTGVEEESSKNEMYLLDFVELSWDLFESIFYISELIYQVRKNYYLSKGFIPINPKVFGVNSKVGRNEFCPCGSGKKYKKCCGIIK
jgi:hypothetical protein